MQRTIKTLLSLCTLLATAYTLSAQSADEIVEKHIQAMGGKAKLDSLKTLSIEGTFRVEHYELPLKAFLADQVGERFNVTVLKTPGFIIVTPDKGWEYFPFQGMKDPKPLAKDDLETYLPSLDLKGPLVDYKSKGSSLRYEGLADVDDITCYKLAITLQSGKEMTGYVDTSTYYIVKTTVPGKQNGKDIVTENMYGNYQRTPDGFVLPFALSLGPGKAFVTKVTVNAPIDANAFDPEEAKKAGF